MEFLNWLESLDDKGKTIVIMTSIFVFAVMIALFNWESGDDRSKHD